MINQFLFDSAFPNGGYSHSFGFESYISWGEIRDISTYEKWLESYMLNIFAMSDGAIYCIAYALKDQKLTLLKLARAANASISSYENLQALIAMTKSTLNNTEFMHDDHVKWYVKVIEKDDKFANPAVAFALLSKTQSLENYAYATIKTLMINATRAVPLAYKKSNELIFSRQDLAKKVASKSKSIAKEFIQKGYFSLNDSSKIFATHNELDMAMFAHEKLNFRLFMS